MLWYSHGIPNYVWPCKGCALDPSPLMPPRHRGASAARPNQAADSSLPSTRRRVPEGASPPQTPPSARLDMGIGYRIPMGEVVVPRPWESSQSATRSQTWARKGVKSRATLNPSSQSGCRLARRVNSAIRERVGLDLLAQTTPPRGHALLH